MNDSKENHSTGSYVEPRNPSITGFGQRKVKGKHKKVLDYSLEKSNDHSGIPKIDVCLRLKPRTNNDLIGLDTLTILSGTTVACSNGNGRDDITEYTFSSVFGPNVDQKTFFNTWIYDKVMQFLNGNNELLFAYGTTNAGKTYTIHGNSNDPGMIPRTLVLVFNTLKNKLMSQCKYKPDKVMAAHILDDKLMEYEDNIRNNIFNNWSNEKQDDLKSTTQFDEGQTIHSMDQFSSTNISKMFDSLKYDKIPSLDHGNVSYTIWVTYSEIYNECIYDLLVSYSAIQKRKPLKLSLDQNKNVYVRDLTHIFVQSAEEAYKVMSFGRNNLKIASNNLNKSSSRSHCIFTLKLMRVENIENPTEAVISSISFCDLAGSERLKKTMNIGDRLTESKNINTSLLVLNKCFSVLRENQKRGENHLVPCRESKLTQMFQTALTGYTRTGISMAVNVDMSPSLLEETKQVLFMSSIVRSIIKSKKNVPKPRPSFAVWATNHRKSLTLVKSKEVTINESENIDDTGYEKPSMMTVDEYEIRLKEEKAKLKKELLAHFHKILDQNNTFHKNQKETLVKNKTEIYENKIKRLKASHLEDIKERDERLAKLISNSNESNTYENNKNKSEMENYVFRIGELELQKEDLVAEIDTLKNLQNLQSEDIDTKNKEIENYKAMLEEANDEYERMEAELNKMSSKFDELFQEMEDKDLEIERLTGALEAKDNIISDMELEQNVLIAEEVDKQIEEYMDEKLQIIADLKITLDKHKNKIIKCNEEKSEMARKYQSLKQQYLNMSKDLSVKGCDTEKFQERIKALQKELKESQELIEKLQISNKELKLSNVKPLMNSTGVLTDINNIQLPLIEYTGKENEPAKSQPRSTRKVKTPSSNLKKMKMKSDPGTPDMCAMLEDAINNIPISTRKRKLFNSKTPFTEDCNIPSDNALDSMLTPSHALLQVSKLRNKK